MKASCNHQICNSILNRVIRQLGVVNHYLNGGSNVYSCLLDASKAVDRVHYGILFKLLLKKNILNFTNLLYKIYSIAYCVFLYVFSLHFVEDE